MREGGGRGEQGCSLGSGKVVTLPETLPLFDFYNYF